MAQNNIVNFGHSKDFIQEISTLIQSSKQRMATAVNAELTLLYWHIGQRINQYVLQGERAEYGKDIIPNLSKHLTKEFGKGWSPRNLGYMMQFASSFPDLNILQSLIAKLSWTHFTKLLAIDEPIKREFYATMTAQEPWISLHYLHRRAVLVLKQRLHLVVERAKERFLCF